MIDNEIIKCTEECLKDVPNCKACPFNDEGDCRDKLLKLCLDLINHKQAEIERLELVLLGVMHSVDKWLDGKELEQDEVNRAATMREKTLQIVEQKQSEIDRQKSMNQAKLDTIHDLRAEIEDLKESKGFPFFTNDTQVVTVSQKSNGQYSADIVTQIQVDKIRAEAYKEFAEEFEKRCIESGIYPALIKNILKNLVKELAHETTETCNLKNKCGSCAYAIPTTFGKSKVWVECTNREHNERYCKREISCKRARTQPACKSYKELTEGSNGK